MNWIYFAIMMFVAVGCGSSAPAVEHAEQVVPFTDAQVGDRTTCPVSGHEFVVTADSPHAEHNGHTYYFCCPGCVERFAQDPEQFLAPGVHAAQAQPNVHPSHEAGTVEPGAAVVGDQTTCPVSGETFTVTETSPQVQSNGRTYYFCCPGCDSRFQENPESFLNPPTT